MYAGPPGSGGFIQFPGGNFVADPSSAVSLPPVTPAASPQPQYGQQTALSYDEQLARWLPVQHNAISSDGSHYAFASGQDVYVVDVRSSAVTEVGSGHQWVVLSVSNTAVFATVVNTPGLWSLPFSGSPRQMTTSGFWQAASTSAAFGTPTSATPQGVVNTIQRLDIATGQITDWFSVTGAQSQVWGVDAKGELVAAVYYSQAVYSEVWVATAAGRATPIVGTAMGLEVQTPPMPDNHGVWFSGSTFTYSYGSRYGGQSGVVLYVPGYGDYWMSNLNVQLAGGCA